MVRQNVLGERARVEKSSAVNTRRRGRLRHRHGAVGRRVDDALAGDAVLEQR
jgi:hypothetical protein